MLYKKTRLEDTFGVNMLAVADGKPETLGLKSIIEHHVDFQFDLATRKYQTLLAKELDKKEIQEGLIKACDVIDLIIEILRGSKNVKDAKLCLTQGITENIKFKSKISEKMASMLRFTERQATAILEMRLYKLIGLEIEALINEHEETMANIYRYEDIMRLWQTSLSRSLKASRKSTQERAAPSSRMPKKLFMKRRRLRSRKWCCSWIASAIPGQWMSLPTSGTKRRRKQRTSR